MVGYGENRRMKDATEFMSILLARQRQGNDVSDLIKALREKYPELG